jgi:hypothetical protein
VSFKVCTVKRIFHFSIMINCNRIN